MKTASVRQLRQEFAHVLHWIENGEEVQITKRRRIVARLTPEKPKRKVTMPDFMARLKAIHGNHILSEEEVETLLHESKGSF